VSFSGHAVAVDMTTGRTEVEPRRRAICIVDDAGCVIVDHHMPGMSGLEVVEALRRAGVLVPTILVTGRLDPGIAQRAAQLGVAAVLEKPFSTTRLVELISAGQDGR
jgi:FixJ family two-component response regulator